MIRPSVTRVSSSGRNAPDLLLGVHHDHDDRQVLGEAEQPGGVDEARGAEPFAPADHARTGEAGGVGPMDDLGVQRPVTDPVVLPDEDRRPQGLSRQPRHVVLLDARSHGSTASAPSGLGSLSAAARAAASRWRCRRPTGHPDEAAGREDGEPHGRQAGGQAAEQVDAGEPGGAADEQGTCVEHVRREGGVAAQDADAEERPQVARGRPDLDHEDHQQPDEEGPGHVRDERRPREVRRAVGESLRQTPARQAPHRSADGDDGQDVAAPEEPARQP